MLVLYRFVRIVDSHRFPLIIALSIPVVARYEYHRIAAAIIFLIIPLIRHVSAYLHWIACFAADHHQK
jgi:hypothetical protein